MNKKCTEWWRNSFLKTLPPPAPALEFHEQEPTHSSIDYIVTQLFVHIPDSGKPLGAAVKLSVASPVAALRN